MNDDEYIINVDEFFLNDFIEILQEKILEEVIPNLDGDLRVTDAYIDNDKDGNYIVIVTSYNRLVSGAYDEYETIWNGKARIPLDDFFSSADLSEDEKLEEIKNTPAKDLLELVGDKTDVDLEDDTPYELPSHGNIRW